MEHVHPTDTVIIPGVQFVAHMTTAVVGSSCVDAFLATATIVPFALVDICRDKCDWAIVYCSELKDICNVTPFHFRTRT